MHILSEFAGQLFRQTEAQAIMRRTGARWLLIIYKTLHSRFYVWLFYNILTHVRRHAVAYSNQLLFAKLVNLNFFVTGSFVQRQVLNDCIHQMVRHYYLMSFISTHLL